MSSHLRTLSSASVLDVLRRGGDPRVRFDGVPLTPAELDEICRTVARPASALPCSSPPLRELSFAACGLGCADAARVLRALRRGGRVGVDLSGNRLGAAGDPAAFVGFMTAVAGAARASAVASLHLSDNGLHADDILLLRRLVAPLTAAPPSPSSSSRPGVAAAQPPPLQLYVSSPPRLPLREMAPPSPPQPAVPRVQARSTSAASRLTFETPPSSSGGLTSFGTPLSTHGGGGGGGGGGGSSGAGGAAAAPSPADDTMLLYAEDDCDEFVPPPPTPPRQSQTPASLLVKREAARSGSSGEPSPRPSDSVAPWCPPAAVRPPAVREESGGGDDGNDAAAPTEDDKVREKEAAEASRPPAPVTPPPRSPPSGHGRSAEGSAGTGAVGGGGSPSPGKERGPRRSLAAELRRVAPAPSAAPTSSASSAAAPAGPSLAASVAPVTPPKQRQSSSPAPTVSPPVPVPSPLVDRAREWRRHVDARGAARPAVAATAASAVTTSASSPGDAVRPAGAAPKKPMLSVSVRQEGRGVVYSSSSDAERSKSCKLDRDVAYEILLENRSPTAHFVCKVVLHGQAMPCLFKVVPVSHHRVSAWRQQGVAVSFAPPLPFPPAAENGKLKVEFYRATVDAGTGRWNYDHRLPSYVVHTDVKSGSKKKALQARNRSVTPTTQRRTRSVSPAAAAAAAASRSGSLRGYRQGTCSSVGRQQRVGAGRQPSTSGGASSASHASSASGLAKARMRSSSRGQRDVSPGALFRRSHTLR